MCSIIKLAAIAFDETSSYWSAPKSSYFSAFHWSPHGCLITIGQHFVTTRVVHLPKRTETSLITESDQSRANHQLLQLCTVRTAWSDSDQAMRAVHSCKSWLLPIFDAEWLPMKNTHSPSVTKYFLVICRGLNSISSTLCKKWRFQILTLK